jgi:dihydroorotase
LIELLNFNIITFFKMLDLIIKNGQCYINGELKMLDVAVKDGKIHKIGEISEEAKESL